MGPLLVSGPESAGVRYPGRHGVGTVFVRPDSPFGRGGYCAVAWSSVGCTVPHPDRRLP